MGLNFFTELASSIWEKSSLLTKILFVWAFGPALLVYMALGYKDDFKSEIKAEVAHERNLWAAPTLIKNEERFKNIDSHLTEIKTDIRDMRNVLIGPKTHP